MYLVFVKISHYESNGSKVIVQNRIKGKKTDTGENITCLAIEDGKNTPTSIRWRLHRNIRQEEGGQSGKQPIIANNLTSLSYMKVMMKNSLVLNIRVTKTVVSAHGAGPFSPSSH